VYFLLFDLGVATYLGILHALLMLAYSLLKHILIFTQALYQKPLK